MPSRTNRAAALLRWRITFTLSLAMALTLAACGGGGGGAVPRQPPPSGEDAVTKQALEDCLPLAFDTLLEVGEALQAILAGNGSSVGASIPPGGLLEAETAGRIAWELETSGGAPAEVVGDLFLSEAGGGGGSPITSQDVAALTGGGIDALGAILAAVPDGTGLVVQWTRPSPGASGGQILGGSFTAGVLGASDGLFNYDDATCAVGVEWTGATLAQLQPSFPMATFDILVTSGTDVVQGTLAANGTRTATVVVSRNGGANGTWSFDLVTGLAGAP